MSHPTARSLVRPSFAGSQAFTLFSLIGTSFRRSAGRNPAGHTGTVSADLDRHLAELADPASEREAHRAACERRRRRR